MTLSDPTTNDVEEKTEIIYGEENTIRRTLEDFLRVREKLDCCVESAGFSIHLTTEPVRNALFELKKRGIKIRFISEITKENIHYCKDMMEIAEVKHLDGIKGNFAVTEFSYGGNSTIQEARPLAQQIISTVKIFVEQQQHFFDMLWQKAIPAKQRIKEIEEGLKREFLETIQDPQEIKNLIPEVISSANEEILLLFSTVNTFKRYYTEGFLDLLIDKCRKNNELQVRILINSEITSSQLKDTIPDISSGLNNLEVLRNKSTKYDTKVTFILIDKEISLVIEIKDDTKEDVIDSVGFATYSNSESSVLSSTSIFETLWIKAEISQSPLA